jgi:hypothetical protein
MQKIKFSRSKFVFFRPLHSAARVSRTSPPPPNYAPASVCYIPALLIFLDVITVIKFVEGYIYIYIYIYIMKFLNIQCPKATANSSSVKVTHETWSFPKLRSSTCVSHWSTLIWQWPWTLKHAQAHITVWPQNKITKSLENHKPNHTFTLMNYNSHLQTWGAAT